MLSYILSKLADATNCNFSGSASHSFSSSQFYYYDGTHTTSTGSRHATMRETDPSGRTTVRTARQNLGEPVIMETRRYDAQGREILGRDLSDSTPVRGQIVDVTEYDSEDEKEEKGRKRRAVKSAGRD